MDENYYTRALPQALVYMEIGRIVVSRVNASSAFLSQVGSNATGALYTVLPTSAALLEG